MSKTHIALVLGTGREERASEHVANYIQSQLEDQDDLEMSFHDVRDYVDGVSIGAWQESDKAKAWRAAADNADAFLFVIPEYNFGYPGEFKMLLDSAFDEYLAKPVLFAGVSAGTFGGARMISSSMALVAKFGMIYVPNELYFGKVKDFGAAAAEDRDEQYKKRVHKAVGKLLVYAEHLKGLSEKLQ